jgi:hypothetical protein
MVIRNGWRWLILLAGVLAVGGCADGTTLADGRGGGIGGTGTVAARGQITGFGSIWVNGTRFDITAAAVKVEGADASAASLQLGMVVAVSGSREQDGSVSAEWVEYADNLEGPIDSLTVDGFRALGQTVVVTNQTEVHGGPLQDGMVVEVSGLVDGNGTLHATYVEKKADVWVAGDVIELKGIARNVDSTAGTFEINGLAISYSGTTDSLAGEFVEVRSKLGVVGGFLVAHEVLVGGNTLLPGQDGVRAELEGFVTSVESAALFTLDGTPVDVSRATFGNGTPADLIVNALVEVEGTFQGGVLNAATIEFEGAGD